MNKSSSQYWLWGGISGLVIGAVLSGILFVIAFAVHDISDAFGPLAENIFDFFAYALLITPLSNEGFSFNISLVISAAWVFLIGAVLGWIYGKLYNRVKIVKKNVN